MSDRPIHPIQIAAARSGLSPHVIRVWERRYGAIKPKRGPSQRRLYSDKEIERLALLSEATRAGHPISSIANLNASELQRLLNKSKGARQAAIVRVTDEGAVFRGECLQAVRRLDAKALEQSLQGALVTLGHQGFLQVVLAPLSEEIGTRWREGTITAAHEHFFSAAAKVFLGRVSKQFAAESGAPNLISCTPLGQLHELGAFMVGAAATNLGWRVAYLGAALPAAEIAGAALQNQAAVVALSIIYPEDDPDLPEELLRLRHALPNETSIIVGGRAAPAYANSLKRIRALMVTSLADCCDVLDRLRREHRRQAGAKPRA